MPGEFGSVWDRVKHMLGVVECKKVSMYVFFKGVFACFRAFVLEFREFRWIWREFGSLRSGK